MKLSIITILACWVSQAQILTKKILFLGNSYTAVNNLPQMIANVAQSTNDVLIFDSNTPGGYTLQGHSANANSLAKIRLGNWDFVVLQEQSQLPSLPDSQVATSVYPYARILDDLINAENPCAETIFYMTWGRKNGDASNCAFWPPVCTYTGMDNLLASRYKFMANSNKGIVSPVGEVWRYIIQNFPQINLYQSDESHPSDAGTYAAACCFYTTIFRKDPTFVTFNATLSTADAANIRAATKMIVFDKLLDWNIGLYDPKAGFNYTKSFQNQILFTNNATNATNYLWDFGDGNTSATLNPTHNYFTKGLFTVKLYANKCNAQNVFSENIIIDNTNNQTLVYPNPTDTNIILQVESTLIGSNYVVYDNIGKIFMTGTINFNKQTINFDKLSTGIYFIRLGDSSGTTFKVIKQ